MAWYTGPVTADPRSQIRKMQMTSCRCRPQMQDADADADADAVANPTCHVPSTSPLPPINHRDLSLFLARISSINPPQGRYRLSRLSPDPFTQPTRRRGKEGEKRKEKENRKWGRTIRTIELAKKTNKNSIENVLSIL